jgi:arylsulfatase A-like enzyme
MTRRPSITPRKLERHNPSAHPLTGSDWDATESAIEFIRLNHHQRFFLYVHYMDVHQYTYDTESALFGTDISDLYDNALHWTDRNVSGLLAELDAHDLLERTIVVVGSDHGEGFYEHGREGHARDLYRQVTEVPLIVSLPFRLEPGIVVESTVQNVDLWPTVLDLVGLEALPAADGRSLVPLVLAAGRGSEPPADLAARPSFAELDRTWGRIDTKPDRIVAVVDGDHRMIQTLDRDGAGAIELYDRRTDPLEQRNVAERDPERVARLRERVKGYVDAEAVLEAPFVELDEMRIMQLRALGYADVGKKESPDPKGQP